MLTCWEYPRAAGVALSGTVLTISASTLASVASCRPHLSRTAYTICPFTATTPQTAMHHYCITEYKQDHTRSFRQQCTSTSITEYKQDHTRSFRQQCTSTSITESNRWAQEYKHVCVTCHICPSNLG